MPPLVRTNGASELVSDVVMICTSTGPSVSVNVNIQIFLNVNLTSRIMNPVTKLTEGLLLIDEPKPGVPNVSNGFPYFGQVLGTPGIPAGASGSGNVYQATLFLDNTIVWAGVPWVTGGTRIFRMTNIRGNASNLMGSGPILSDVAISGPVSVAIVNPESVLAQPTDGLKFTSSFPVGAAGTLDLTFTELFPSAFKKRIENTLGGPLTASYQDVPGVNYCTESGFTPEFSPLTPGAIGSANTGTRLLAEISNVPPGVFVFIVPNEVNSTTGNLVAHRVFPPLGGNFAGGTVSTGGGLSLEFVTAARTAELLYEVTASAPFLGKNGCGALDAFTIPAFGFFPVPLTSVNVKGRLAPVDPTPQASASAPEPRFLP
ncbi:MAG: hypothetical protein M3O35_21190 [Acidobacteriota bacterium]|nr:hypothetical protein [Acidobacteriota bacterium]